MEWKYQMLPALPILTNCLGSCRSLNFNILEKGEMPTDPVSPTLSFYVLDIVGREKRKKCNMDSLR